MNKEKTNCDARLDGNGEEVVDDEARVRRGVAQRVVRLAQPPARQVVRHALEAQRRALRPRPRVVRGAHRLQPARALAVPPAGVLSFSRVGAPP